jgi:hypothetical protein
MQLRHDIRLRRLDKWRGTREQASDARHDEADDERLLIDERTSARKIRHQSESHDVRDPVRHQQSRGRTRAGEQQALGEQLPRQPRATHTERDSNGDLSASLKRPQQQERRDVGYRNNTATDTAASQSATRDCVD